ncbi:MAG TPA: UDP-N-acetylmuramoyl-L-alanyl-D-glutamate--2,6-diaminopimelate ligase [Anaerolineales bacterium]|nr:UDP-N-acetylmuramoyl-L-alanyl-D-glutamate--2,6-diaminopimelate ligase [Anaerolineales bacterium]
MTHQKSIQQIFAELPAPFVQANVPDVSITGISIDSRVVKPGHLFVAMKGGNVDSHQYIQNAVDHGATAIVGERDIHDLSVPYIRIENPRRALTWIAAAFHDWPARKLTMIGVTGTDGKTTTTNLIYKILIATGIKAGMVSTVNAVIGDEVLDTGFHVTTPDAHDVQAYLARMVDAGLTHVVLETTSHGWAQYRVDACEFDIGVVTNITHEHMDEHGSYENYRAAKARLFSSLEITVLKPQGNPRLGVINRDDTKSFDFLNDFIKVNKMNYGLNPDADVHATNIEYSPAGIHFKAQSKDFDLDVSSNLLGAYNVSNCLAALTATICGLNINPEIAAQGIASLEGIPGRMEVIDLGQNFTAIVDFAHTPNALKVTLEAAREMLTHRRDRQLPISTVSTTQPRIIAVFGSAGLRDKAKRRMMAETAAELADLTVLTAEDPRTESLDEILEEMAAGARSRGGIEGETFWRIPDRGEAIRFALRLAQPGDIVVACGKGHEQSMCFGRREHLWDDRTAMRAALAEFLGLEGPQMPYLPTQDTREEEWLTWK